MGARLVSWKAKRGLWIRLRNFLSCRSLAETHELTMTVWYCWVLSQLHADCIYTNPPNSYYSASEVYHRSKQMLMEILSSRSSKVAYDPRTYSSEIVSINASETLHNSQNFLFEAVPGRYPNDKNKAWEPDSISFQNLVKKKASERPSFFKRHWILITIFCYTHYRRSDRRRGRRMADIKEIEAGVSQFEMRFMERSRGTPSWSLNLVQ